METGDILPSDTENVTELELKKAFRSIILYMGELNTESVHSSVIILADNFDLRVDVEVVIENIEEINHE